MLQRAQFHIPKFTAFCVLLLLTGLATSRADHWSFQKITRPTPPVVDNSTWAQNDLDRFILRKLKAQSLKPTQAASREAYIRRVSFDLIGLPPTPKEIDQFLADDSPDAKERLIDRLLASSHYGERWGRHWLDLARFGETDGFEHDPVRPNAWRYRDYVIASFNADKPYDQFIREQVAGDLLYPDDPAALVATGFNLLGPDMVDSSDQKTLYTLLSTPSLGKTMCKAVTSAPVSRASAIA